MKNRTILISSIVLVLLILTACSKVVKVNDSMNGGSVTLNQGEKLEIKLSSNPTTGYNWEIVQIDSAIVQQVGDVEYKSYSKRIGSGGVNTYTFQAASEGKTHLTLIYHRSFEKDTPPIETFDLDIEVK